jgi:hypothetical protein
LSDKLCVRIEWTPCSPMMCQTPTELTSFSVCTLLHLSKALVQQRVSSAEPEARDIQKWSQLWIMRERLIQNKLLGRTPRQTNWLLLLIMSDVYINDFVQLAQTTDPNISAAAPTSSPSRHSLRFSRRRQSPDMRVRAHSPKK